MISNITLLKHNHHFNISPFIFGDTLINLYNSLLYNIENNRDQFENLDQEKNYTVEYINLYSINTSN